MGSFIKFQRVELEGKTYDVKWHGELARVSVLTKRGPRTLSGRRNHSQLIAHVLAAAKSEAA